MYTLVKFCGKYKNISVYAYEIFLSEDWQKIRSKIENNDNELKIYIGEFWVLKDDYIRYDFIKDILNDIEEINLSEYAYESFCNIMPTYFGDERIFETIGEIK